MICPMWKIEVLCDLCFMNPKEHGGIVANLLQYFGRSSPINGNTAHGFLGMVSNNLAKNPVNQTVFVGGGVSLVARNIKTCNATAKFQ